MMATRKQVECPCKQTGHLDLKTENGLEYGLRLRKEANESRKRKSPSSPRQRVWKPDVAGKL